MDPICYKTLEELPTLHTPCALSIGTFDGVHLGHQSLCRALSQQASPATVLLLFTTPPHQVLRPDPTFPGLILSLSLRETLLREQGIDHVVFLSFSPELSLLSYDYFLRKIRQKIAFHSLVLGKNAVLGHQRQGTQERLAPLAAKEGWNLSYIPQLAAHSSTKIRLLIQQGALSEAAAILGRPYSLQLPVDPYMPWPLHLCLPPPGIYALHGLEQKLQIRQDRTLFLPQRPSPQKPLWIHFK